MSSFLTYKKFQTIEEAQEVMTILEQNNIPFEIEDNSRNVSDFLIGQDTESNIHIKINQANFEKANELMNSYASSLVNNADLSHYLFTFENQELLEIITEPDKWSEYDFQLAKKILNDRGVIITNELEKTFQEKRKTELAQKEKRSDLWTIIGYISAFLGGVIGIGIGLTLWTMKKTLPNGERVYTYSESDRRHGRIMTVIGVIMAIVSFYLQTRLSTIGNP